MFVSFLLGSGDTTDLHVLTHSFPTRRSSDLLALLHLSAELDRTMAASSHIIDGNVDRDFITSTLRALGSGRFDLVGITVMGGPQLAPAIAVSRAIRDRFPGLPIAWGGYFPTLNTEAAIGSPYVDYVIRGPGDKTLPELVAALFGGRGPALDPHPGQTWQSAGGTTRNPDRCIAATDNGGERKRAVEGHRKPT